MLQALITFALNIVTMLPVESISGPVTLVLLGGGLLGAGTGLRKLLSK